MLPKILIDVEKDGQIFESITLGGKSIFTFGSNPNKSNVVLMHASISRIHSALIVEKSLGVLILDLMSKAGTYHNGKRLTGLVACLLKVGDTIVFG